MFSSSKKDLKTEILAGITAFFAISYIIVVNPLILADSGIPAALSVFATIFISIIGCLVMAFWADAPIVLVPGMGVNAFFTYTVVVNMGLSWQEALAISMVSGIIFAIIACTPCSIFLSKVMPQSLKYGITAGIGLFLVEIGLEKASLIEQGKNSIVQLASLQNPAAILALFGLILSLALYLRNINGSFFIAIVITSIIGNFMGLDSSVPVEINLSHLLEYKDIIFQMDFSNIFTVQFLLATFSMSMILIFETMGMLEGLLPQKEKFKKTFSGSSIVTIISSLMGTSPTVAAAESAAGIASGGKTGIMALTAAILFILSLFFVPFLSYVPQAAVAPVIIITGAMMMQQLQYIEFNDFTEWFPAFLLVVLIPLTGSISTGLSFGFVSYPLLKIFAGKSKMLHPMSYCLGILFFVDLVFHAVKSF